MVEHVEPRLVAAAPLRRRPQRVRVPLTQPQVDVEVVALFGPQHSRQRLPHDRLGILAHGRRCDGVVELIRFGPPGRDQLAGPGKRRRELRSLAGETHQHRRLPACGDFETDVRGRLGSLVIRVYGARTVQQVVADAVLGKAGRAAGTPQAGRIRFVLAEQQVRVRPGVQVVHAELVMLGPEDRMGGLVPAEPGLGFTRPPRPVVAEPQRGQHVQRSILRRAVVHRDAAEDVVGRCLRVLHLDVEVASLVEDARIRQLVLEVMPRPGPVHRHEVVVGELGLRVLVEPALIAVRREVVQVEVVFLDVLTVVALGIGQAEETLFQNRVPLVPQRQGQAEPLLIVADPGEAILTPPVRPGPRLVMAEIGPGIAIIAVILPHRSPLALTKVRSPGSPWDTGPSLLQPAFLRRSRHRISRPGGIRSPHHMRDCPTQRSIMEWPPAAGNGNFQGFGNRGSPPVLSCHVSFTVRKAARAAAPVPLPRR